MEKLGRGKGHSGTDLTFKLHNIMFVYERI